MIRRQPNWFIGELEKVTDDPMLTGTQIRMARGYLRWSVKDLAEASGVSSATIKRMEEVDGVPKSITDNLAKLQAALEANGIQLIPANGGGPGIRLREPSTRAPDAPPATWAHKT